MCVSAKHGRWGGGGCTTHKPSSTLCEQLSSVLSPFLTGRMCVRRTYFGHFDEL